MSEYTLVDETDMEFGWVPAHGSAAAGVGDVLELEFKPRPSTNREKLVSQFEAGTLDVGAGVLPYGEQLAKGFKDGGSADAVIRAMFGVAFDADETEAAAAIAKASNAPLTLNLHPKI